MPEILSQPPAPTTEAEQPKLLTKYEAARKASINPRTLENWVKAGRFPKPVRIGTRTVRWRPEDVDIWLKSLATAE